MRTDLDATFHLRLPAALRRDLDGAARASGGKLSPIARKALALGLRALTSQNDDDPPPAPPGPAVSMPVAA